MFFVEKKLRELIYMHNFPRLWLLKIFAIKFYVILFYIKSWCWLKFHYIHKFLCFQKLAIKNFFFLLFLMCELWKQKSFAKFFFHKLKLIFASKFREAYLETFYCLFSIYLIFLKAKDEPFTVLSREKRHWTHCNSMLP
jgi:hypothetical protein